MYGEVFNFGCRVNSVESQIISDILNELKLDIVIVNTCTITNEADRQCRQKIRSISRENPEKTLVVTGCASAINADKFIAIDCVNFVISNDVKLNKQSYLLIQKHIRNEENKIIITKNSFSIADENIIHTTTNFNALSRAPIKIQDGCDHFCAFCIVPFARSRSRSLDTKTIVENIQSLVENGYNEIILTGIDLTHYGQDFSEKISLGKLCKTIFHEAPQLKRLRLSSVDVAEIDDDMYELLEKEKKFMPYFHISLQSGSNAVLKRMRRRHTRENVISFCKKAKLLRPDVTFGADIIAGFASETEDEFNESLSIVEECGITFMHAFPYSKKEKTLGFSMPDAVSKKEKQARVRLLMQAGMRQHTRTMQSMLSTAQSVVVEKNNIGRAENFMPISLGSVDYAKYPNKSIAMVKCVSIADDKLLGEIV